jgi:chemotaxis protein methyltransferase WspC
VKHITELLSREIGLNAASIGKTAIDAAVKARLRDTAVSEVAAYVERLERNPAERRALIEEIVVSETWFFRDEEVFKAFGRRARTLLRRDRPLRVLSLPCATGEEAYSLSVSVLELGYKPSRYSIRAVDVSMRALEHAKRGVYGGIAFRGAAGPPRPAYFEPAEGGFRVMDLAREAVTFSVGNVLDTGLFPAHSFDVVFCRNLLIYLDNAARARALQNLAHWLSDDGVLFVGHAESVERMGGCFRRLEEAAPFGYSKEGSSPEPRRAVALSAPVRVAAEAVPTSSSAGNARPVESRELLPSLERATEFANAGKLGEARGLCERVIAELGASPDAYCLLGVIDSAAGQQGGAIQAFNKALYLNQSHYESLVHLALLHEQRGEIAAADNFRRRAERARRGAK